MAKRHAHTSLIVPCHSFLAFRYGGANLVTLVVTLKILHHRLGDLHQHWRLLTVLVIVMVVEGIHLVSWSALAFVAGVRNRVEAAANVGSTRLLLEALTGFHLPVLASGASANSAVG